MASEFGPVPQPDDVADGKIAALNGRAEVRDVIDVDGLLKAGSPVSAGVANQEVDHPTDNCSTAPPYGSEFQVRHGT